MKKNKVIILPILAIICLIATTMYLQKNQTTLTLSSGELPANIKCENIDCLLSCIREVETGGSSDKGCSSVGDGGMSHGPYQIQQSTIDYASRYNPSLKGIKAADLSGKKLTCDEKYKLSEDIMKANWAQAATANAARKAKTWSCEDLARIHNGGPTGHTKDSTVEYWNKVKDCYDKCVSNS